MAHNIFVVVTLCAVTFVINVAAVSRNIGFVGTKGKHDITEYESNNGAGGIASGLDATVAPASPADSQNLIEKSPNGIAGANNDLYLTNLPDRSMFKRTPSGFVGMRGKKDYEYSDGSLNFDEYEPANGDAHNAAWFNSLMNEKRTPTGFVGMRGKRKPTSGFYGVRGKKDKASSLDDLYEQLENLFDENVNYEDLHQPNDRDLYRQVDFAEAEKRANRNGFVGVRGRRFPYGLVPHLEEYSKRVPNGFMGMRGRRFDASSDNDLYEPAEKRKTSNAFFGVRGKKDVSKQLDQMYNDVDKRSPLASYFGVRGEKRLFNSNGFFGTRGKKQPYEFRGKFVGVRGKKSMIASDDDANMDFNSNFMDGEVDKRTPNGFIGMRG